MQFEEKSLFNWFLEKGKRQGIFWGVSIYFVSSINDVLMKLLGERLSFIEISFFRFLISTCLVTMPMLGKLQKGQNLFRTTRPMIHLMRGILGAIALSLCCLGVNYMPMAENTVILFSESLFLLLLSSFILKEKISLRAILATVLGLLGLVFIIHPDSTNLNIWAFIPLFAAFLFAVMDIIIKKMVNDKEHQLTMLFYFGAVSTMLAAVFLPLTWIIPNFAELVLLFGLGIGANLIQMCLFMMFKVSDANMLSPLRYSELLFATFLGFMLFDQVPNCTTIVGAALIIWGTVLVSK